MKPISTEQQLELANRLREYGAYIADIEFSAETKTEGVMDGLADVCRAADFIESLATGDMAGSTYIGAVWAARATMERDKL